MIRTFFSRKGRIKTPWPKVPGRRPILGNSISSLENIVPILEGWAKEYGTNGIFETKLYGTTFYVICNEKYASEIERRRPYIITRRQKLTKAFDSLGAKGLASAEGENWRKDRRIVAPSLNHKNVMDYIPKIKLVASGLVRKWEAKIEDDPTAAIAIDSDIHRAGFDLISSVLFGKNLNRTTEKYMDMGYVFDKLVWVAMRRTMSPIAYWNIPVFGQYLDGGNFLMKEAKQFCLEKVNDLKNDSEEEQQEKAATFAGKMIELSERDSISPERFVGNLITMYSAGTDTSATTLKLILYEIAKDVSGIQNELIKENFAMGKLESADLDMFTNSLPRLRSLVYEVLRIKGPVPFTGFESTEPIELDGVELPAQSNFFVLFSYITKIEECKKGNDAKGTPLGPLNAPITSFCARRWLTERNGVLSVTKPSFKNGFRAFGGGVRHCPGRGRCFRILVRKIFSEYILTSCVKLLTVLNRACRCGSVGICFLHTSII